MSQKPNHLSELAPPEPIGETGLTTESLDANYDRIFCLFSDEQKLANMSKRLPNSFTGGGFGAGRERECYLPKKRKLTPGSLLAVRTAFV